MVLFSVLLFIIFGHKGIAQTEFNKYDDKGKKHGLWKGVYEESKRPRYEGTFDHGKETGIFKFYDDTKAMSVIATREFNLKNNAAFTIFFDQKGNKVSEGNVINKLFDGQWKYYHQASKTIMTVENYVKGKLEGVRYVYYPNSAIAEEISYKNNLKNGLYKKIAENGVVLEESIYKDNVYDGVAIFRDAIGVIVSQGKFVNGKKMGIWQFYEKGKLVKETNMCLHQKSKNTKNN
ncbi:MORN repeat protein [Flavobacterium tiangeerense]|uniref:MORN repeat protein n=2 Tax=Flavobacterium tiangeerense TaxID=459471 RepID=A0ABY3FK50_9FLAO|nr:MORN repeat protein [Flavobacterium tiangeerense]